MRCKQRAQNVAAEAETKMRSFTKKVLEEFDATVTQREIEIVESAQVRLTHFSRSLSDIYEISS